MPQTRSAHADPWDAVLAELTAPAGKLPAPASAKHDARPTTIVGRGNPFSAHPESIQCVKQRAIEGRRLYAVTFDSPQPFPAQWRWLIAAEQQTHAWVARGGAGGAGDGPHRSDPWVNLAGWWGPNRFYAGGEILGGEKNVKTVRLNTQDGLVLEDDTEGGVVLFLTDRTVEVPVRLEMLEAAGRVLATQVDLELHG